MDFVARWGGEEFVALLADTDFDHAVETAERIRKNVAKKSIPLANGTSADITVSLGVNSIIPTPHCSLRGFIGAADAALYRAKHEGRNRVCKADPATEPSQP